MDSSRVPRILLLMLLAGTAGCGSLPASPGVVEVHETRRLDVRGTESDSAPAEASWAGAARVTLPDDWDSARRRQATGAWYRADITLDAAPRDAWAVYLPQAVMSATVWVNGTRVASSDWRNLNRPFLAPVAPATLHAGPNVIDVRLRVPPTYRSVLGPFFVGPEAAVRPAFERRLFWQSQVVEFCVFVSLGVAGLGLALWMRRREPGFVEFASGCVLWGVAMLEFVVGNPLIPELLWQWLVLSAMVAAIGAFAIGARRFLGVGSPGVDRVIMGAWGVGATALASALWSGSARWTDVVVGGWALSAVPVGSYLLMLLLRIRQRASQESLRLVGLIGVVGFVVFVRDAALTIGLPAGPTWLLVPYLCAAVGLWGGWRIVERFVDNLDAYQALNRELERRVSERGDQIARGYERIHVLERERAVQDERVRLMRDIHDGFGSQLTSMLALVEQKDAPSTDLADALRDALDDMRLVVYSLAPRDADLITLLASWRARIERRLQRHGLRFEWLVSDLPPLPWLGPRESLQVLRIFQETISNVVQHAGATTITVRTAVGRGPDGRDGVFLHIGDDGRGFRSSGGDRSAAGAGLRNMASRAHDLGGVVSFSGEAGGASVSLWLPLGVPADVGR